VISGEEEAIYGWTAVNFVKGALIRNSEGSGAVSRANKTYGVLEMGGASAQIGLYEPNGDVMANLFKLQLGAAKHWNVYTHSFLYFGVNGAYARFNAMMVARATRENQPDIYNPCLPGGSEYLFTSRVQLMADGTSWLPLSSPQDAKLLEADLYSAVLRNTNARGDFDSCYENTQQLLRKEANAWCDFAHDRDCSFAGIYQPPLPIHGEDFGEFIATSNFYEVWEFLQLRPRSTMMQLKDASRRICYMSLSEVTMHNRHLREPITDSNELAAMCFRAAFVTTFLINGVGFPLDYNVTALDVVNGQKLGWALGSMLYEINTLPWEFKKRYLKNFLSLDLVGVGVEKIDSYFAVIAFFGIVIFIAFLGMVHRAVEHHKRKQYRRCRPESAHLIPNASTLDYGTR
jgi:Golgi nucleoside diphosphatase